jgi:hypothetical protein
VQLFARLHVFGGLNPVLAICCFAIRDADLGVRRNWYGFIGISLDSAVHHIRTETPRVHECQSELVRAVILYLSNSRLESPAREWYEPISGWRLALLHVTYVALGNSLNEITTSICSI